MCDNRESVGWNIASVKGLVHERETIFIFEWEADKAAFPLWKIVALITNL